MLILGIETSCDETAVALVRDGKEIVANVVSSQVDLHRRYGGVVPEIACRAHLELLPFIVWEALQKGNATLHDIEAVAVTAGPGLVGALLVGLSFAKGISFSRRLPLIGINHLEAHLYANFMVYPGIKFPLVALIVSGGHTDLVYMINHDKYRVLGRTRDDAAGEAFDKVAKILGLGYPGGPIIEKLSSWDNVTPVSFPRPFPDSFDFSFSGLKTAVLYHLRKEEGKNKPEAVAAGFQAVVIDVLVGKTVRAACSEKAGSIILCGGVAANKALKIRMGEAAKGCGLLFYYPPPVLCTDNAAMVAGLAFRKWQAGKVSGPDLNADPNLPLEEMREEKGEWSTDEN